MLPPMSWPPQRTRAKKTRAMGQHANHSPGVFRAFLGSFSLDSLPIDLHNWHASSSCMLPRQTVPAFHQRTNTRRVYPRWYADRCSGLHTLIQQRCSGYDTVNHACISVLSWEFWPAPRLPTDGTLCGRREPYGHRSTIRQAHSLAGRERTKGTFGKKLFAAWEKDEHEPTWHSTQTGSVRPQIRA